jgi:hypothetical protein
VKESEKEREIQRARESTRERESYRCLLMYFFFLPLFFARESERECAREKATVFLIHFLFLLQFSWRDTESERESARGETSGSIPPEDCNKEGPGEGGKARGEARTWLIMGEAHRLGTPRGFV